MMMMMIIMIMIMIIIIIIIIRYRPTRRLQYFCSEFGYCLQVKFVNKLIANNL